MEVPGCRGKGDQFFQYKRKAFIAEIEIILFRNYWLWNYTIGKFHHVKITGIVVVTVLKRFMLYMKSVGQILNKAIYIFTLAGRFYQENVYLVYLCNKHREVDVRQQYYEGNYFHCEAKDICITSTFSTEIFFKTC